MADAGWTALGVSPSYADEPSGANCVYSGVLNAAKAFFASDAAQFEHAGAGSTRQYSRFTDHPHVIGSRILLGIHFCRADVTAALLGQSVAEYVTRTSSTVARPAGASRKNDGDVGEDARPSGAVMGGSTCRTNGG